MLLSKLVSTKFLKVIHYNMQNRIKGACLKMKKGIKGVSLNPFEKGF